ncbi:MAG TPA: RNA 2'-phosphotransferase [Pilimelia sp.]|nr:RNA 2'-phosphotransferase [Pilimelia sp.]
MDPSQVSRRLSEVLRHRPDRIGLTLDAAGWVPIPDLLAALAAHGQPVTRRQLAQVVAENDKRRFTIEGDRIRANQGHSVAVELGLPAAVPPAVLFHGTARRHLDAIMREGLRRGTRHHVHLSTDAATARAVGARHGVPVVLRVDAAAMAAAGHLFYRSANGVWLTDAVPPDHLAEDDAGGRAGPGPGR